MQAVWISQDGSWVAIKLPTNVAAKSVGWVNSARQAPFDPAMVPYQQP
jgi:hypothetical protein